MTRRPSMRRDDFQSAQFSKIRQISELSRKHRATVIQTGDLCDIPSPRYWLINAILEYIRNWVATRGNHDSYGASPSEYIDSALEVLVRTGIVRMASPAQSVLVENDVEVYGCSYFDPTPVQVYPPNDRFKVLIAHHMVLMEELYREQDEDEYFLPEDFVSRYADFDLVVCGHYHYRFFDRVSTPRGFTDVINPGAVVRVKASKGDKALKPGVCLYDTDTQKYEWIMLDAAPSDEVFYESVTTAESSLDYDGIDEFVAKVMSERSQDHQNLDALVDAVLQKLGCTNEVSLLVREVITQARSEASERAH